MELEPTLPLTSAGLMTFKEVLEQPLPKAYHETVMGVEPCDPTDRHVGQVSPGCIVRHNACMDAWSCRALLTPVHAERAFGPAALCRGELAHQDRGGAATSGAVAELLQDNQGKAFLTTPRPAEHCSASMHAKPRGGLGVYHHVATLIPHRIAIRSANNSG